MRIRLRTCLIAYIIYRESESWIILISSPITHIDELKSIEEEWKGIYSEGDVQLPFLSFDFLKLWYQCFSKEDQVRVYRVADGKRVIGFLPLRLYPSRNIKLLASLTNDHCFHSGPLVLKGFEQKFSKIILRELLKDRHAWDLFRYEFSYSFSEFPELFSDDLLNKSGIHWQRRNQPTYIINLNKPFEKYFREDLSSNARKNIMKNKNKLKRAGVSCFQRFQGEEAVQQWPEFLKIEDSGWKGNAGTSIKQIGANYQQYYWGLMDVLIDNDALIMFFLVLDGRPIAGVFGYFEGDTFHWAKTGYDEKFKELSPSNLLMVHIIENLIENFPEIKRFHMFPWHHNFKHRYANNEGVCMETILFSRTFRGEISYNLFALKDRIKIFLQRKKR